MIAIPIRNRTKEKNFARLLDAIDLAMLTFLTYQCYIWLFSSNPKYIFIFYYAQNEEMSVLSIII
jgi:hypothetical protein